MCYVLSIMPKLFKLKNGIQLLAVPVSGTKAITVLAMFPIGSRYEHKKFPACRISWNT